MTSALLVTDVSFTRFNVKYEGDAVIPDGSFLNLFDTTEDNSNYTYNLTFEDVTAIPSSN